MKITIFAKNVVVQQVLIFISKSILVYFTKQIENNEIMRM
jgi:hypothetical protein